MKLLYKKDVPVFSKKIPRFPEMKLASKMSENRNSIVKGEDNSILISLESVIHVSLNLILIITSDTSLLVKAKVV